MKKVRSAVAFSILGLSLQVSAQVDFSPVSRARHIYGPEIKPEELQGKVVFLEYWGVRCPPCRGSFPHLVKLQDQYGDTGKFTILAAHVQADEKGAAEFCADQKVNFPVFQQLRISAAPCGRGIPSAVLIDHTGKIVQKGHPSQLYSLVKDLVKSTPDPPSPLIGKMKVVNCVKHADALKKGKPILPVMSSLKKISAKEGTPAAAEAAEMLANINRYLDEQAALLQNMAASKPSLAWQKSKDMLKQLKGTKQAVEINRIYLQLNADPSLKKLAKLRSKITILLEKQAKRASRGTQKKLDAEKAKLEKLINSGGTSEAVTAEAEEYLKSLK